MLGRGNEPQLSVTSVIMGEAAHALQCSVLFICGALQVTCVTWTFEYNSFQLNDGFIKTNHSKVWFPNSLNLHKAHISPSVTEKNTVFVLQNSLLREIWLWSLETSFYKGGRYFYPQPGFLACLSVAAALSQWVQKQTRSTQWLFTLWLGTGELWAHVRVSCHVRSSPEEQFPDDYLISHLDAPSHLPEELVFSGKNCTSVWWLTEYFPEVRTIPPPSTSSSLSADFWIWGSSYLLEWAHPWI